MNLSPESTMPATINLPHLKLVYKDPVASTRALFNNAGWYIGVDLANSGMHVALQRKGRAVAGLNLWSYRTLLEYVAIMERP